MSTDSDSLSAQVNKLTLNDQSATGEPHAELVNVVDDLLEQLNTKFGTLSSELITKMDEMSQRLDNLEATLRGGNVENESEK